MTAISIEREVLREIADEMRSIRDQLRDHENWLRVVELEDDERERVRSGAQEMSDLDLVEAVMTMQKVIEKGAHGKGHRQAQIQTTILTVMLERFAPVTFGEALDEWERAVDEDA